MGASLAVAANLASACVKVLDARPRQNALLIGGTQDLRRRASTRRDW
jgi:hypothetical protein